MHREAKKSTQGHTASQGDLADPWPSLPEPHPVGQLTPFRIAPVSLVKKLPGWFGWFPGPWWPQARGKPLGVWGEDSFWPGPLGQISQGDYSVTLSSALPGDGCCQVQRGAKHGSQEPQIPPWLLHRRAMSTVRLPNSLSLGFLACRRGMTVPTEPTSGGCSLNRLTYFT